MSKFINTKLNIKEYKKEHIFNITGLGKCEFECRHIIIDKQFEFVNL